MSAPDIGVLRGLAEAHTAAIAEEMARSRAFAMAAGECLRAAFGDASGWYGTNDHAMRVTFDKRAGLWKATTWLPPEGEQAAAALADTPTAAVRQALDALAETHPTEAAELRKAVTFKEPTP